MESKQLTFSLQTEQDLIPKETPSQRVIEITVRAPERSVEKTRPHLNLAIVLDRSGSMAGPKLPSAQQAALHVMDLLGDQDRASVVAFDDQVWLVAGSTPVTPAAREEIKRKIQKLAPGGMTDLAGGWFKGCEQVAAQLEGPADGKLLSRVLLLTDGQANRGITSLEELSLHARQLAERGVATSTFGVGYDFNEHLLEAMANQGQGSFYFIASPVDIPRIFMQEFDELSAVTARNTELVIEIPGGVNAEVLGGWPADCQDQKLRIALGDLQGGREQKVYVSLLLPHQAGLEYRLFVKGIVRWIDEAGQDFVEHSDLVFTYADAKEVQQLKPREDILQRASLVRLSDDTLKALQLERSGRTKAASELLQRAVDTNRKHLSQEVISDREQLVRRMERGLEEDDRKSSHYKHYRTRRTREDLDGQDRQGN